jgi:hypothetical protein
MFVDNKRNAKKFSIVNNEYYRAQNAPYTAAIPVHPTKHPQAAKRQKSHRVNCDMMARFRSGICVKSTHVVISFCVKFVSNGIFRLFRSPQIRYFQ